jgi:hypothetical protein
MKQWAGVLLLALALGLPVISCSREMVVVDQCLDGGGSFDYISGICDDQHSHPFISFPSRHAPLLAFSGIGAVLAIGLLARRPRRA